MNATICFTVPGDPVPKERPRQGRTRTGDRVFYTPKATKGYESLVQQCGALAMRGRKLFEGPVEVKLFIGLSVPRSWPKQKREAALREQILPTAKPDVDNVEKAVCDGLNGIAWKDDAQITDVIKCKRYTQAPGVSVWIRPVVCTGLSIDQIPDLT